MVGVSGITVIHRPGSVTLASTGLAKRRDDAARREVCRDRDRRRYGLGAHGDEQGRGEEKAASSRRVEEGSRVVRSTKAGQLFGRPLPLGPTINCIEGGRSISHVRRPCHPSGDHAYLLLRPQMKLFYCSRIVLIMQ